MLYITLYELAQLSFVFNSVDESYSGVIIQVNPRRQYFYIVQFMYFNVRYRGISRDL